MNKKLLLLFAIMLLILITGCQTTEYVPWWINDHEILQE